MTTENDPKVGPAGGGDSPSGGAETATRTRPDFTKPMRQYLLYDGVDAFRGETGTRPTHFKKDWSSQWIRFTGKEPRDTEIVGFKFHDQSVWDVKEGWN